MNQYLKMIVTQTVQFILILVIYHNSTGQPWFQNKVRDTVILISSYLIFMIIPLFSCLFRPIVITVKQESKLGKGVTVTPVLIENNSLKTHQTLRTINLTLEITRRGSVWWSILYLFLRKKKMFIVVESTPNELLLQPIDPLLLKEVTVTDTGFKMHINPLIDSLRTGYGKFSITKSYTYFIADHPDIHIPHNLTAIIQPRIFIRDKPLRLLKFFIKYETSTHQIGFYRR